MTVRCDVESTHPTLVVRLAGALSLTATWPTWHTLVKLLSDQPDVLVLDLTDTSTVESRALVMFGAVARRASLWPGIPVVLAAPDPQLRADLHRLGIHRQMAVCGDRAEALLLADGSVAPPRLREHLEAVPGAARRARDLTTEACLRWQLDDLVAPACVIASELVTNAVRHTAAPCELSLARTSRYLHIGVRDGDPTPAVLHEPDLLAVTGRGLLVVARTALRWGSTPAAEGKVVWATIAAG